MEFPDKFECDKDGDFVIPSSETIMEFTYKGITKKVINTSKCEKKVDQIKANAFDSLNTYIMRIIYNKEQVKRMRYCDLIAI